MIRTGNHTVKTAIAALVLGILSTSNAAIAGEGTWYADFDKAAAVAKEQGKDLFVDFTGSDWCGWCKRLDAEVFSHEEFLNAATKKFVLVALDFPRDEAVKAKVPNPDRNAELSEKYEVQGFPTILLMTPEGEVFGQTGYRPDGPVPYVAHLEEITAKGKAAMVEVPKAVAAFSGAEGEAKVAAWENVVALLVSMKESPFAEKLVEPTRWAIGFDADNTKGMKKRAVKALLESGFANDDELAAAELLDPKNEAGMLEMVVSAKFERVEDDETALEALAMLDKVVATGFKDQERGFALTFMAAMWSNGPLKDGERAKKYAAAAKAIGSDDQPRLDALDELLKG